MRSIALILVTFLSFSFFEGCGNIFSKGPYVVNIQVKEKGVATDNNPKGMESGTLWVSGGNGYLRFQDSVMWKNVETGKFYVMQFDRGGWVFLANASAVEKDYAIVGD